MELNMITFYRGDEDIVVRETKDYLTSIFREQYAHALVQIEHIICSKKEEIPSIVAFCGDRGEGKTSCMETIKAMLNAINYDDNEKDEIKKNLYSFMSNCVIDKKDMVKLNGKCQNLLSSKYDILDTIDPAFFDNDHNVIELVLGRMYKKFKEKSDVRDDIHNEKRQQLLEYFHKTELQLRQLKKDGVELYDPMDELDWLSGGMSLQESFQELCSKYLDYMMDKNNENPKFLVIPIDDIDLNVIGAYEMAEQIRKYLCANNCIILMSLNIDQLIEVISNYIAKLMSPKDYLEAPEMAIKYVTKFIPMEYRVYMPKPYDFCDRELRYVLDNSNTLIFTTIKEGVVKLIYDKTRYLFYNSKGAVSPIVPNNLRGLRHLMGMLVSMAEFNINEDSMVKKNDFKSYFYSVWTRQLSPEHRKKAMKLVNVSDVTNINKTAVFMLAPYIKTNDEDKMAASILSTDNYNYNVSVGDVFYLIEKISKSNVDSDLSLLLFFIQSYYSIALYENYDVITEQENALYPDESTDIEIFSSGQWMKRTNKLQRLLNGGYFTYNPEEILPTATGHKKMYRDTKVYSGMIPAFKSVFGLMDYNIRRYVNGEMTDAECQRFIHEFRIAEFFALTTKRGIRQREAASFAIMKRNIAIPYNLTNYLNTNYFVFDVLALFNNVVNIAYSYSRFAPLMNTIDNDAFFEFAKKQKWSLLHSMIEEVKKKEYRDDFGKEISEEELKNINVDDENMHRLMSNAIIRNSEVLLAINEMMESNRLRKHFGSGDSLKIIAEFYKSIINSEMKTYYTPHIKKGYTIRFSFLNALINVLKGEEKELLKIIFESGPSGGSNEYEAIELRFKEFFDKINKSKRKGVIIKDMIRLYPKETMNMTQKDWDEIFPCQDDESVNKNDILRAFSMKAEKLGLKEE